MNDVKKHVINGVQHHYDWHTKVSEAIYTKMAACFFFFFVYFISFFIYKNNTCVFLSQIQQVYVYIISVKCGQGNELCYLEEKGSYCLMVEGILAIRENDGCL